MSRPTSAVVVLDLPTPASSYSPTEHVEEQLTVTFEDVTYSVKQGKRTILHGLSGRFGPGQLTALMGPSGSGKSTLLDILAGAPKSGAVGGRISYTLGPAPAHHVAASAGAADVAGAPPAAAVELRPGDRRLRRCLGYVEQADACLLDYLTVREQLTYVSRMLAASSGGDHEDEGEGEDEFASPEAAAEAALQSLGLAPCADTRISRVSGGQRRRCSIAVALLGRARALFLDEPTSGLDSHSAMEVMAALRGLADGGMAVVTTIHQPSRALWALFDEAYLLVGGARGYWGPAGCAPRAALLSSPALPPLAAIVARADAAAMAEGGAATAMDVAAWLTTMMVGAEREGKLPELLDAFRQCKATTSTMSSSSSMHVESTANNHIVPVLPTIVVHPSIEEDAAASDCSRDGNEQQHEQQRQRRFSEVSLGVHVPIFSVDSTSVQQQQQHQEQQQQQQQSAVGGAPLQSSAALCPTSPVPPPAAVAADAGSSGCSKGQQRRQKRRRRPWRVELWARRMGAMLQFRMLRPMASVEYWAARYATVAVLLVLCCSLFWRKGNDTGPHDQFANASMLFLLSAVAPASSLVNLASLLYPEKALLSREVRAGYYRPAEFLVFRLVSEGVPFALVTTALTGVAWAALALRGSYWLFLASTQAVMAAAMALVVVFSSLAPTQRMAALPFHLSGLACMTTAGFLVPLPSMTWAWRWFAYANYLRYSFVAQMLNFFGAGGDEGSAVLDLYALSPGQMPLSAWQCVGIQAAFVPPMLLIALVAVWHAATRSSIR